jgi:hypothetical protein
LLPTFAFNFDLRRYTLGSAEFVVMGSAGSGAHADVLEAEHAAVVAAAEVRQRNPKP